MNEEDFEIDDILGNLNEKKARKKNTSKKKGNRGENQLCDVLEERFKESKFFRVTGSGNRWSQVDLTDETRGVFTGDVVCPSNFRWVLECKYGYDDIELMSLFATGHKKIDEWKEKAQRDADSLGKKPMLCWRKPRQSWLAFLPADLISGDVEYRLNYRDWSFVSLELLLKKDDDYWFKS